MARMKKCLLCLATAVSAFAPFAVAAPLSAEQVANNKAEWERRCADAVTSHIVWNAERTAAVVWIEKGADCYSYDVWCLRADEAGRMQPVAYVTAQADAAYLKSIDFTEPESILLNMARKDGEVLFRYAFDFSRRYGVLRYMENNLRMISERKPGVETLPGYDTMKKLNENI